VYSRRSAIAAVLVAVILLPTVRASALHCTAAQGGTACTDYSATCQADDSGAHDGRCDSGCTTSYTKDGDAVTEGVDASWSMPEYSSPSPSLCSGFDNATQDGYSFRYMRQRKWCSYDGSGGTKGEVLVMQSIDLNELPRRGDLPMCTSCTAGDSSTVCGKLHAGDEAKEGAHLHLYKDSGGCPADGSVTFDLCLPIASHRIASHIA
jgi:hypothetical protein